MVKFLKTSAKFGFSDNVHNSSRKYGIRLKVETHAHAHGFSIIHALFGVHSNVDEIRNAHRITVTVLWKHPPKISQRPRAHVSPGWLNPTQTPAAYPIRLRDTIDRINNSKNNNNNINNNNNSSNKNNHHRCDLWRVFNTCCSISRV